MPWIEFAADMSGVCSVAGTLLITSNPTSRLSTKMLMSDSSDALKVALPSRFVHYGRQNFFVRIGVPDENPHHGDHVRRERVGRRTRHRSCQVGGADQHGPARRGGR